MLLIISETVTSSQHITRVKLAETTQVGLHQAAKNAPASVNSSFRAGARHCTHQSEHTLTLPQYNSDGARPTTKAHYAQGVAHQ